MNPSGFEQQTSLYALIVAGGSGSRMQSSTPKQFLTVGGKPILFHTLEAFYNFDPSISIVLVLPEAQVKLWKELKKEHNFNIPHAIVEGGNSRFQSVKNGLALVPMEAVVAIHDGVRPFISSAILQNCFATASETGSAIVSVPLKESIRRLNEHGSQAEDRSLFRMVQTPQTFQARLIKKAYRQEELSHFTDCASVAEADGNAITLIEGSYDNIKITTPGDILFAENLLKNKEL